MLVWAQVSWEHRSDKRRSAADGADRPALLLSECRRESRAFMCLEDLGGRRWFATRHHLPGAFHPPSGDLTGTCLPHNGEMGSRSPPL